MSDAFRFGSHATDDVSNIVSLSIGAVAGNYGTFRVDSSASGYQVPNGKTLTITKILTGLPTSGSSSWITIGYGDDDVGYNSASAPTNRVKLVGNEGGVPTPFGSYANVMPPERNVFLNVPAGKYPYMFANSVADNWVYIEGYLH